MPHLTDIALRSLLSLGMLFFMTKLMGRRQISQLSFFDYVIGISIGSIASAMATETETAYIDFLLAIFIYTLLAVGISLLTLKSIKARRFFIGAPIVLIQEGKILEKNLRRARFDVNDLLEECRFSGYFDLRDIHYALMESTGRVSFLPRSAARPLTGEDLSLQPAEEGLCANIIIDGCIMRRALKQMGRDENWLKKELSVRKLQPRDILLATLDIKGEPAFYLRKTGTVAKDVLE